MKASGASNFNALETMLETAYAIAQIPPIFSYPLKSINFWFYIRLKCEVKYLFFKRKFAKNVFNYFSFKILFRHFLFKDHCLINDFCFMESQSNEFFYNIFIFQKEENYLCRYIKNYCIERKKKFCFAYLQSNMKLKIVTGISLDFCEIWRTMENRGQKK